MKYNRIFLYTIIFFSVAIFGLDVTMTALTGKGLLDVQDFFVTPIAAIPTTKTCTNKPVIPNLSNQFDPELQKLSIYQTACNSYVTNTVMIETQIPSSTADANTQAGITVRALKAFALHGIHPIVAVQPITSDGVIDFTDYTSGYYDKWIDEYFVAIQKAGITDQQMGMWVAFPEANLPYWNGESISPTIFALMVNSYLGKVKNYFPKAQGSILLNTATYDSTSFSWTDENYQSLAPYTSGIQSGLIDSAGVEGYPWVPSAQENAVSITQPNLFLNQKEILAYAASLHIKSIWLNTGTFQTKYTLDKNQIVYITPEVRKQILEAILVDALKIKEGGYNISINLYEADESGISTRATDWSYIKGAEDENSLQAEVFKDFIKVSQEDGIPISLYDGVN